MPRVFAGNCGFLCTNKRWKQVINTIVPSAQMSPKFLSTFVLLFSSKSPIMQKMILLLALSFGIGSAACAQKTPSTAVIAAFNQKFANVKGLKWEHEKNGDWEAEFEQGDMDMSANFNSDGKWLETETEIKVADLPAPVLTALKGKKVKEAAKILRADGSTVFEAEVKHKDMLFDASGKLISQGKD
jgi:Putative beta-lactamase-inhibitor-like, PepSY-like